MPRYTVECYQSGFRYVEVSLVAEDKEEAIKKALDKVNFDYAEWNETEVEVEDVWREDDE